MDISSIPSGWVIVVWFGLIGLCVGSFVNVVCYRLPIIRKLGVYADGAKLQELVAKHGKFSLASPRSCCPCCDTQIKDYHNIPVIGWILLRGKCRACGSKIGINYPLTELLFGVVFAVYVAFEGIWLASLMSLPMMVIAYCMLVIRAQTGRFIAPLIWAYGLSVVAQAALAHFGFSAYSA